MFEIITRRFRIEEEDDAFLCEADIWRMPGYMEQKHEIGSSDIIARFYKKVI